MFYGEEDSSFQNLPPEMIVEVLSLVDLEGKQSTRLVCRRWRWILDHPNSGLVSFETDEGMTEESIQCLLKSQLYIHHLVLKDVKMTWPKMTYSRNKFPPIRQLTLKSGNSHQTLLTILQYGCAQTESLTLDYRCFGLIRLDLLSRVLSGMRWNHLTELKLKIIPHVSVWIEFPGVGSLKNSQENVKGMELILKKAKIPNLRVLSLKLLFWFGEGEFSNEIQKMMSNFTIFLEHHSKTLRELKLCLYSDREEILIFPNISASLFSAEQQKSVARDLKLECLDISTTHFDAMLRLVPPCVWESEYLTKLKWEPMNDQYIARTGATWSLVTTWIPRLMVTPGTTKPLEALIQRNRNTLTNVTSTFILGDIDVDPFDISWIQSCPHVSELTITICDKFFLVKLQLPTVRKLDIGLIKNFVTIESLSTWILRTFRNLETVQFSVYFTDVRQNWEFNWIQNLLVLPRLGEIRFRFTYWRGEESQDHPLTGPNLIRQYCSDKARLIFKGKRQSGREDNLSPTGPCFIKVLPIQYSN